MLDKIRHHRDSLAAKIVLIAIAGSFFIGFGVLSFSNNDSTTTNPVVARVDGKPIYKMTLDEAVVNMTDRYRKQLGAQFDEKLLKQLQLETMALQTLINREVLLSEANRNGFHVTDDEVRDFIMQYDAFKNENGHFDPKMYERALRGAGRGLTPAKFEADARESILIRRIQTMVDNSVLLTDDQLKEIYVADREKANVAFVAVGAEDVAKDVKISDADVKTYYDAHKAEFAVPEQRKFKYIEVSPAGFSAMQNVTDDETKAAYEKRKGEFKQDEEVRASHVLFKVEGEDQAAWDAAKKKADDVVSRARKGEDFAKLATTLSEDSSASNGGDLGFFGRDRMVKAFEETAFALKVGSISDPVKSQFGWHVIKVTDKHEAGNMPLEEVRVQLDRELRVQKGEAAAKKAEEPIRKALDGGADLDTVAKEHNLIAETSPLLTAGSSFPGLLDAKAALEAGFTLEAGKTSKLIDAGGIKVAIKLLQIEPARQRELNDVRHQVEHSLRIERAAGIAAAKSPEILASAKASGSLAKSARGLKVQETGEFSQRSGEVPTIGKDADVFRTVFSLRLNNPFPDRTFKVGDKHYVLQLKERKHADMANFESEKAELAAEQLQKKRDTVFQSWLQSARTRTKIENLVKMALPMEQKVPTGPDGEPMMDAPPEEGG